jgi:hypothetical protein
MDDLDELTARNRIHRIAVLRSKVGEQADRGDKDTGFVSGAQAASGG